MDVTIFTENGMLYYSIRCQKSGAGVKGPTARFARTQERETLLIRLKIIPRDTENSSSEMPMEIPLLTRPFHVCHGHHWPRVLRRSVGLEVEPFERVRLNKGISVDVRISKPEVSFNLWECTFSIVSTPMPPSNTIFSIRGP